MSDDALEWKASLSRPSMTLSRISVLLGMWTLTLSVVNLTIGAYSGKKALWSGFLLSGDSNTNSSDLVIDDVLFLIIGLSLCYLGIMGIRKSIGENDEILDSMLTDISSFAGNLFSVDNTLMRLIGSWLIVIGLVFYLLWSIFNETWVDPGVYSVMISLVSFGYGILIFLDSES